MRMGFRWMVLFVAGAACAARGAHAEDIGHEPLLPERLSAPAPGGSREPAAGPSDGADADLSLRGPSLSDRPPSDRDMPPAPPRRRWYGWQTLLADALPVVELAISAGDRDARDSWLVASAVTYFAGGPVVHLAHGHGDKALLSLGVRATGPLLVFAGTSGNDVDRDSDSARVTLAVLGALCIPAAIVIDAAAIAREEEPRETGAAPRPSVALSPWIEPRRGGGGISLAGSL